MQSRPKWPLIFIAYYCRGGAPAPAAPTCKHTSLPGRWVRWAVHDPVADSAGSPGPLLWFLCRYEYHCSASDAVQAARRLPLCRLPDEGPMVDVLAAGERGACALR